MFFNVDILYRNGPLALVWLAGNGDSIMKSGPTRSKYKTDIMKADLHRIIELIFEQLPSVGRDKGMSLKKIVCLYHGVVVIHHMQLEASIKRLTQMYFEACKLRDLDDCNQIDVAPLNHKDLNLKQNMPLFTARPNTTLTNGINVEETYSPRRIPQLESERFETFEETSFGAMMLNLSPRRTRGEKRKEENVNEIENHGKVPRLDTSRAEFVTVIEENVTNLRDVNVVENEEQFEDWDMGFDGGMLVPRQDNVNEVVEETTAADLNDLQFEDEQNIYISPENRRPTVESNQLPLRPLQLELEPPVSPIDRRRPRRILFNAETTINEDVWRKQVKTALGYGDFNARLADLQSRAAILHAVPKSQYRNTVKGLKFILGSGRNLIGFQLNELNSTIVKSLDNSLSHSRLRGENTTNNSRVDSRILEATHAAASVQISREEEIGDYPPLNNEEFGNPELMETSAGHNGAEIEHRDENENYEIPNLSPIIRRIRNTSTLPPATTVKVGTCNVVNEDTVIEYLKTGEKLFSDIFPTNSTTRLQAAQGMMLLLRMKNDRKLEMLQTANNGSVMYGVITIRLIERKRRNVTD